MPDVQPPQQQSGDPDLNTYSTDNSEWPVLETYTSGSIIEIKTIINNNHWVRAVLVYDRNRFFYISLSLD